MSRVARYGKAVAREGHGNELAAVLLTAAEQLQADLDASIEKIRAATTSPRRWRTSRTGR